MKRIMLMLFLLLLFASTSCAADSSRVDSTVTSTPSPAPPTPTSQMKIPTLELATTDISTPREQMSATPTISGPEESPELPQVQQAKEDLANRLNVPLDQIQVLEVRSVVWPDSSLGCPQPGMAYKQVPEDGLLIRLQAAEQFFNYHSGGMRAPFLCEPPASESPQKSTPIFGEDILTRPSDD